MTIKRLKSQVIVVVGITTTNCHAVQSSHVLGKLQVVELQRTNNNMAFKANEQTPKTVIYFRLMKITNLFVCITEFEQKQRQMLLSQQGQ